MPHVTFVAGVYDRDLTRLVLCSAHHKFRHYVSSYNAILIHSFSGGLYLPLAFTHFSHPLTLFPVAPPSLLCVFISQELFVTYLFYSHV